MNRLTNIGNSVFGASGSSPDANKLYSILLDTRASAVSENMYDIAEKLLKNEKENAKNALEQLWALKKNLQQENENSTIDLIITYYQQKLDVLRTKEEHIKKVSRDSRELLEEKRKRDAEIATVKQEVTDCSGELERLNKKLSELNVKEQELTLIDTQLDKELKLNANEVINGLYEIILATQESGDAPFSLDKELEKEGDAQAGEPEKTIEKQAVVEKVVPGKEPEAVKAAGEIAKEEITELETAEKTGQKIEAILREGAKDINKEETDVYDRNIDPFGETPPVQEAKKPEMIVPFPKSVVKTTRGSVIGEYYYDSKVYKNKRHYVYNSNFIRTHLTGIIESLARQYDQAKRAEAMQMIHDAFKRIGERPNLHFEISTNEILNKNTLKDLWQKIKNREYADVLSLCNRLKAKIEAMGNNYIVLLTEQMARYSDQ